MTNYGYSRFAEYYDILTKNICYKDRAAYFNSIVEKHNGKKGILLDLGCGTGSLSEEMSLLSYDVIGVDNSQEMLSVALEKKLKKELPIQYLYQDMTKLDMFGTIDVIISALDSINHLKNIDAVKETFDRVALFCEPGGLFIFDVNTEYKHEKIIANNTFIYDSDNVYCIWKNNFVKKDCKIVINLDFFERSGDVYHRSEETFFEIAYPIEILNDLLLQSGFEILAHYDNDSFKEPTKKSEKVIFVARKVVKK